MKRKYETPSITIEKFDLYDPEIVTDYNSFWGGGDAGEIIIPGSEMRSDGILF